jgi:hypothetical protein
MASTVLEVHLVEAAAAARGALAMHSAQDGIGYHTVIQSWHHSMHRFMACYCFPCQNFKLNRRAHGDNYIAWDTYNMKRSSMQDLTAVSMDEQHFDFWCGVCGEGNCLLHYSGGRHYSSNPADGCI